ncbi:MAG: 1-acyl-sn-glycerol-3-phosphate acyltransferase [Tannerella sp.]|jgi:1-acyl-sn-glycerol-3-phosphate acyltransferase|nr:1-acyl-sn-glycerol-3-phosphate acyltransferase [Tannerella sp.]
MTKFFLAVYDFFVFHKRQLFALLTLLLVVFAGLTMQTRFKEDISSFLPETKENERINNAYRHVISANKITVYCSAPDSTGQNADNQIEAIEKLAGYLQKSDSSYIKSLMYKVDPAKMLQLSEFIVRNMPYFLDEKDYQHIDSLLSREAIANRLKNNREQLMSPIGMIFKQTMLSDPLGMANPVLAKLHDFQISGQFLTYRDYIFTDDHKAFLLIECAMPASETNQNAVLIDSLDLYIDKVQQAMEGKISFHHFGASEIALTNASQIKKDTLISVCISLLLIFAILIYSYRSGKKIFLIFFSILFGGLFAMALMYLIRGEVSIIAIGISSIMFGIAVNYPLHFIDHHNYIPHPRKVINDIVEPLTIGNITTVGAFLSLIFIGSGAMQDLGLFASLLLVGTIVFVLFFLPHFLPAHQKTFHQPLPSPFSRFIGKPFEKNRWVVGGVLLLTVVLGFFSPDTHFETNMQGINYMTDSQQKEYQRMMDILNKNQHVMYYVTEGENPNQALETNEQWIPRLNQLIAKGILTKTGGLNIFYPSLALQAERVERWNGFWDARRDSVLLFLREESMKLDFKPDVFDSFEAMLHQTWEVAGLPFFEPVKEALFKNFIVETGTKTMVINLLYTDAHHASDLEKELNRFDPSSVAFDSGSLTRRMVESLSDNFDYVLYVCALIVLAFLIVSLGRLELGIIAFIPLAFSWIWILGLMNIFDIRFNIVNIILATFIFGQGDDYTIFMTEGLMYEYARKRKILFSYKNSIALSALIMFIGIGSLIFAKHPALRSLAEVTIIGMSSVVIMSYIFPSLLFNTLTLRKGNKRLMPVTLKNLSAMTFSFVYFLIFSLLITLAGSILFAFGPKTEKKKYLYHVLLQRIARFTVFRIPQVKTTYENLANETFEKPGIIICNHQSHLDLMCIMMLTPKLVILTNDWVWNSPFYGRLIRYADFYPISDGFTNALAPLSEIVKRGYSVVTFPEGTRSEDCSIRRFRKGAFFLAEQLQLDIIPVMIHGVGHVLPKKEFMLRKGKIHIRVMERIKINDSRFSNDFSSRSKEIRRFYREQYQSLSKQIETPDYYSDLVIHNYIYKGASVERAVRRSLRRNDNFKSLISQLPDEGKVVVVNSGYGEFALLLALVKKQLQIVAYEENSDLRDLAANCASVSANLVYTGDAQYLIPDSSSCRIWIENGTYKRI